jgi:hypothetical protein
VSPSVIEERRKGNQPELDDGGLGGLGLSLSNGIGDGVEVRVSVLDAVMVCRE